MKDMPWREAIEKALRESGEPMHYTEIAQWVTNEGYRRHVGATPSNTVAANLSASINEPDSPFIRVERGVYTVRNAKQPPDGSGVDEADEAEEAAREMGLINAFGMFWSRDQVNWRASMPHLYGVQQSGSTRVNFTEQAGVYVLYDRNRPIYVGKVTEPRLGRRLLDHTRDRLAGRWDRFSWFGVRRVNEDGQLSPVPNHTIAAETLIATMEALLIEGLEPPQNRRQGEGFFALEFIQEEDPNLAKEREKRVVEQLLKRA